MKLFRAPGVAPNVGLRGSPVAALAKRRRAGRIEWTPQMPKQVMRNHTRLFLWLRFDDRVGVIVFSRDVEMIGEFTDPRARVIAAIEQTATAPGSATSRFSTATGTSFYDALYLALEESPLKQVEGRKAIVCMSDG